MSDVAQWYVVHTYSGYENKVKQNIEKVVENRNLKDVILEVKVPTETVTEIADGKVREIERKLYPGYVIIKMVYNESIKDAWYVVKNTRGVTGFVGPNSEPTPLSEKELETMFGKPHSDVETNFAVGDSVKILGTSMDGFPGIVQSINTDEDKVGVMVSMLGRDTLATFSLNQVMKVDD